MHDHATCEQLMTAATRAGDQGRVEYLATRCDMQHGRLTATDQEDTDD